MLFAVIWDGFPVGMVEAATEAEARERAEEKYGPIWGPVEIKPYKPRSLKPVNENVVDPALHL